MTVQCTSAVCRGMAAVFDSCCHYRMIRICRCFTGIYCSWHLMRFVQSTASTTSPLTTQKKTSASGQATSSMPTTSGRWCWRKTPKFRWRGSYSWLPPSGGNLIHRTHTENRVTVPPRKLKTVCIEDMFGIQVSLIFVVVFCLRFVFSVSKVIVICKLSLQLESAHHMRCTQHTELLICPPSLGVIIVNNWLCLSVPLSVTLLQIASCFFVSGWNRAISCPSVLHVPLYKTVFFDFWFRPPKAQSYLPKICTKSPISRLVWQIDWRCLGRLPGGFRGWPIQWNHTKSCGSDTCFHGLGAEIQSPTGLFYLLIISQVNQLPCDSHCHWLLSHASTFDRPKLFLSSLKQFHLHV